MSGRDINPFADPKEINPFADPSITNFSVGHDKNLDNYNPFEKQGGKSATSPSYNTSPAMIEPTNSDPPPTYQQRPFVASNPYGQTTERQRQEELERKAAELEKKEQELKRIQSSAQKENNFPPLPKFFCVQPCFYHDISLEIPIESQKTCKILFYLWQLYSFTLFFNFITAIALLATGGKDGGTTLGVSILYMVLFIPCSFLCWYRPIYKALKSDSSFNYMMFFFVFFFQIIYDVICALGIGLFGSCGWINGANEVSNNKAVAGMMFVTATLWTLLAIFKLLLLRKVHSAYRRSGASFEKAQVEFGRGVASNKNVQNAAAEAVKGGLQSGTRY
ncbi:secretory carrier-associated membrane protein 2 isoform X5 [Hydra vulgaris]|uniref:Secretory carrier-associated membrane protein n=2 Tax=Hydra vulgaris TaxID=6087 RepID=A0ABM4DDB3_HYDVU